MKLLFATSGLAALLAAPALAQDAPITTADDDAVELDAVTVFGRPLGRVPGQAPLAQLQLLAHRQAKEMAFGELEDQPAQPAALAALSSTARWRGLPASSARR